MKKFYKNLRACPLFDGIADGELPDLLSAEKEPMTTAERLVDLALGRGGRDNITVLVVQIEE